MTTGDWALLISILAFLVMVGVFVIAAVLAWTISTALSARAVRNQYTLVDEPQPQPRRRQMLSTGYIKVSAAAAPPPSARH